MKQILVSIFQQNHESTPCLPVKPINCEGLNVAGIEWMVPVVEEGIHRGYRNVAYPEKPQTDAVKTIRVTSQGQVFWIAVADDADLSALADACNLCCDNGTPTIDPPAIVGPYIMDCVCEDEDGNYTHLAPIPAIVAGQKLNLAVVICDGDPLTTPLAAGYANAAAVLAWVQANLAGGGDHTWSLVTADDGSQQLKLVTTECECATLQVSLLSQKWCADVAEYPLTFDKIVHNGHETELDDPIEVADATELIAAIANYFADGQLTSSYDNQIQYEGTGAPDGLYDGEDQVLEFAEGACVPEAPTAPVTDDVANTFDWTNNPNYTAIGDYEYSVDSGATWNAVTVKPQTGIAGAKAAGVVMVRVKASGDRPAGASLSNVDPFTA